MGVLALVGGGEAWGQDLVGDRNVVVLPTAAAYERPERSVLHLSEAFSSSQVEGVMVLGRTDAEDAGMAARVRSAGCIVLSDGSSLHLRSVLKDSAVWAALVEAYAGGALVIGLGAGAMVLTDPMVDPRGGAITVGLGLVSGLVVVAHFDEVSGAKAHRSIALAPTGLPVVGVPDGAALVREEDGSWRADGPVAVYVDGAVADLSRLR